MFVHVGIESAIRKNLSAFLLIGLIFAPKAKAVLDVEIVPEKQSGPEVFSTRFRSVVSGGTGCYRYVWDFDEKDGIGTDKITAHPSFVFSEPGKYTVTLTVRDSEDHSGSDTCVVEVFPFAFRMSKPIDIQDFHPEEPSVIENLDITNSDGNGITLKHCSNIIIRNNDIHDLQSSDPFGDPGKSGCAIYLFECDHMTIENNYCRDNQGGIYVTRPTNSRIFDKNIKISNNVVTGSRTDRAINVFQADSVLIENNYVFRNGDPELFEKHRAGGIWVWDASHILIQENITIQSSSDGIGIATTEEMLRLDAGFLCSHFVVSGNTVKQNYEMGVWLTGIREGKIFDNYIDSNCGPGSSGVNLEWNASRVQVFQNIILRNTVCGIHLNNAFDNEIDKNIILNHSGGHGAIWCRQVRSSGTFEYPIIDSKNNRISNNLIYNNSHAIKIDGNSDPDFKLINTVIANNTIDGNGKYCENDGSGIILLNGADSVAIFNNIVTNNDGFGMIGKPDGIRMKYNNVWNNGCGDYSGLSGGVGDISADPMYLDRQNGNFHLNPRSPSVDAGDPSSEYANEPDPNGDRINQGCYGNTPEAAVSLETMPPPDLTDAAVYPVPFYHGRDQTITFFNLPCGTDLCIFNILGQPVHRKQGLEANEYRWSIPPNRLQSGVYFYCLSDDHGMKKKGKIMILK
ncbi:right-handed parallel beta-helix repeat-containing protein [bacterium]|nr:right-handed parallel beta-helix repeat-containing protein [bacterium]